MKHEGFIFDANQLEVHMIKYRSGRWRGQTGIGIR